MTRLALSAAAVAAAALVVAKLRQPMRAEPPSRGRPDASPQAPRATQPPTADAVGLAAAVKSEFFVDMHCGGCVNSVKSALSGVPGVESVDISIENQTVVTKGTAPVSMILSAIEGSGRNARLIGRGDNSLVPSSVGPAEENTAAVSEFKGRDFGHGDIAGVVRIVQVTAGAALVDAALDGLQAGERYSVVIHKLGDLTRGAESTGEVFEGVQDGMPLGAQPESAPPLPSGVLGSATADANGRLVISSGAQRLQVWDIIGRSTVIHEGGSDGPRLAAAVVARSAAVGGNHKKICACDGTIIWEA